MDAEAVYAIVKLKNSNFIGAPEGQPLNFFYTSGITGTCFFVTDRIFIGALHTFSRATNIETTCFLVNDKNHILTDFKINTELQGWDMFIGETSTPVEHFLTLGEAVVENELLTYHGFSVEGTINSPGQLIIQEEKVKLLSLSLQLENVSGLYLGEKYVDYIESETKDLILKHCETRLVNCTAPIGFSGGPLVNQKGEVVGLQSMQITVNKSTSASLAIFLDNKILF